MRVKAVIAVVLVLLLVACAAAAFLLLRARQEPLWEGEKVSEWLSTGVSQDDLLHMGARLGPEIFPTIRRILQTTSPADLDDSTNVARIHAVLSLIQAWGPEAALLLPDVLEFRDRQTDTNSFSLAALHAVAMIAPEAPEVTRILSAELRKGASPRANASAVIVLARVRHAGFLAPLSNAVARYDPMLPVDRLPAREVLALSMQGAGGTNALPFLLDAWQNRALRGTVLASLLELGTNAAPAAQQIGQLLRDEENRAYWPEVLHILGKLGPLAEPATAYMGGLIDHRDPVIQGMAAYAAARIRERPDFAVPVLVKQLENTNYTDARAVMPLRLQENLGLGHREAAAWFLGELGSAAASATPRLIEMLESRDVRLALFSARAVARLEGDTSKALPVVQRALISGNQTSILIAAHIISEVPSMLRPLRKEVEMAMANDLRSRRTLWLLLHPPKKHEQSI